MKVIIFSLNFSTCLVVMSLCLSSCATSRKLSLENWRGETFNTKVNIYITSPKGFTLYPEGKGIEEIIPSNTPVKVECIEWHANITVYYFRVTLKFYTAQGEWRKLAGIVYSDSSSDSNPDAELGTILE